MKQLNKPSDNMGGLLKIWAVPPAEITIGSSSVSFASQDNIVELYCSPGSMSLTEKESITTAGTIYKTEIAGFAPKDSAEAQSIISGMTGRKWVVIVTDQNEQHKVAGTPTNPLRVKFDLATGSDTVERNGHSISFYGDQLRKAKFIADPFAV